MTARFSSIQRNTRGHRPRLQFGNCNFSKLSPTLNCTPFGRWSRPRFSALDTHERTSVVLAKVHSRIHLSDLVSVPVEHKRRSRRLPKKRISQFADALFARLAPARVFHGRIDIGEDSIRLWPGFHPSTE